MPHHIEDDAGKVVWRALHTDAYGAVTVDPKSTVDYALRWPGHRFDEETGLHYNRYRDYDPRLGRYLEPDPLGHAGGVNLYAYSKNPMVDVDLLGLYTLCQIIARIEAITGRPIAEMPTLHAIAEHLHGLLNVGSLSEREADRRLAGSIDAHDRQRHHPDATRDAMRDLHRGDADDAAAARMMLRREGLSDAAVNPGANIDPNSAAALRDPSRRPQVTMRPDGVLQATVSHGPNAGTKTTIIRSHNADQTIDGVTRDSNGFVVLNSRFDTVIDDSHLGSGNANEHFRAANENLGRALEADSSLADRMGLTDSQTAHLARFPGSPKPPDNMTWHHHQNTGRMQLVTQDEHRLAVPHSGGMSVWGGGYDRPTDDDGDDE